MKNRGMDTVGPRGRMQVGKMLAVTQEQESNPAG